MKDPYEIWVYATRVSDKNEAIAGYCGVDPEDPAFKSLMRSMVTSGFLRNGYNRYLPGNQPPPGPLRPAGGAEIPGGDLRPRMAPSGVPFAEAVTVPEPGPRKPAGIRERQDGSPEVSDDVMDRIAKADVVPPISDLVVRAAQIRGQFESDWGDDDAESMLEKLLQAVEDTAAQVGFAEIGEVDSVVPYDAPLHSYRGKLPPSGMTSEVVIVTPGQSWTHRGQVMVIRQAEVDLLDDEMGQFRIWVAGDLEVGVGEDPMIHLWFNDAAPHKPQNYGDEGWYLCTQAVKSTDIYAACQKSVCDHPRDDQGSCDVILFHVQGSVDFLAIPCGQLVTSAPA